MSPHSLKTFVANRVSKIQRASETAEWAHVQSKDNPADFISRGQTALELRRNKIWFDGPEWLTRDREFWPKQVESTDNEQIPETRVAQRILLTVDKKPHIFERFSSISRLNRCVAYCRRWLIAANRTQDRQLSNKEIQEAHVVVIRQVQATAFSEEIQALRANRQINNNSKLIRLHPFLDDRGILRVGGRLKHAPLNYDAIHPILLPRAHHVTKLIITDEHVRCWHAGTQGTLSAIRQRYWPIDGRNVTRQIIHRCIQCFRNQPTTFQHNMGNLPHNRIIFVRAFYDVGLDYCGPFYIKEKKSRNKGKIKAYVAVFVCFATKAIHLEVVSDLSADTCLACIKRFSSRRGKPRNIYSDNATNFVGSRNEMAEIQAIINTPEYNKHLNQCLAEDGISWHFSPPRSPHFGGLWKAAVKSFKAHLRKTVGNALFTFEQMNTCVIKIEAILNSQALTPISSDPNDLLALSSSHFLIGDSMRSLSEINLKDVPVNRLSQWQQIQQVKHHFWTRWQRDYLHELHIRSKWHIGKLQDVPIGTMVVIKEGNIPPLHWRLGRIVEIHPGDDGIIRVANVKTCSGTYKRAIRNLCPLPLESKTPLNDTNH